jgi:hypothetical protein
VCFGVGSFWDGLWALWMSSRTCLMACSPPRAEAGSRPGSRPTFLSRDKKVGKETRPNARDPCASLRGNLRRGACGVAAELAARWRAPLRHAAASQMTKQSCPSAGLQPRNHHAAGAFIRGVGAGRRFARPRFESERSDALAVGCWLLAVGCWLLAVQQPSPSAHACVGRDAGWQACRRTGLLRHLTRRDCLSGARNEFHGTPRIPPSAGRP